MIQLNKLSNIKSFGKRFILFRAIATSKIFYFFLTIFVLGNFGLYHSAYSSYKSLATTQKIYESTIDLETANPETLLSEKFSVEPNNSTQEYSNYSLFLILLIFGTELFTIASVIFLFKRHEPKRYLLAYFLVLQILIFVSLLVVPTFASGRVIKDLNKQADSDLKKRVDLLSSAEGLKQLAVKATASEIASSILLSSESPKIIDEETDRQALIQSLSLEDKDTLYRVVILPQYLLTQEGWGLNFEAYLFKNGMLVIKKPSKELLSNILPVLTRKIINSEIEESLAYKKEPKFNILSDDAYNIIQTQKSEKIKAEFLSYINEVKSSLADANKYIPILQSDKKSLEEERVSYKSRTDKALAECKDYFGADGCRNEEDIVNKNIASIESDLRITNDNLQGWSDLKPKLVYALQLTQVAYEKFLKFPLTPELQAGVFNPPDVIYLKYYSEGEMTPSPSDYLSASLHEYFHYQAYNPAVFLPAFLDEGLTDYLTSKLAKKYSLRQDMSVHYPEEITIIQELIKIIPEDKLISAYFNQSEKEFEKLIDSYYSKGVFEEFKIMGENLTYINPSDTNSKEQAKAEVIQLLTAKKNSNP